MNTIWIVMPVLIILMFLLGLDLNKKAFVDIAEFDYNEFYKYLNENSNSVIREKLYEAIHK